MEISSITAGQKLQVTILFPHLESMHVEVDEGTTVEALMKDHVWSSKHLKKEVDPEFYWLFKYEDDSESFDWPIPKDRKILK